MWPASFALARAYLDQLERGKGWSASKISSTRAALDAAEKQSGAARSGALNTLATSIAGDASGAKDGARVQKLSAAVKDLAAS